VRLLVLLLLLLPGLARAEEAMRIVGGPGGGCIAGATPLPETGPGFQTIRASHSWFWGAPGVIAALRLLGREAEAAGLPDLYMNDISKKRGGPFPGVHASHMLGLDADVWLDVRPKPALTPAQRDAVEVDSLVRPDGRSIDAARWRPEHETLIHLATGLPGVDRVLVNAAIKRQLCATVTGDRSWLRLVRPWYGHAAHMHVHFRCPPNQPECIDAAPPPPGESCDASLQWWFDQLDAPPKPALPPRPVVLPAACAAIMAHSPG
jgi:penicillin-insensitive murein endopeptidase